MPPRRSAPCIAFLAALLASRAAPALEWTEIARSGDPAIGLPGDRVFTRFDVFPPGANGEVFYTGETGTSPSFPAEPSGILAWSEDASELLIGYGDDPSLEIQNPIRIAMNRHGDWAIADWSPFEPAPGCDPETSTADAEKLVRSTLDGGMETLVEFGSPVPGPPDGLRYAGIQRWGPPPSGLFRSGIAHLNLADSGALVFGAELAVDPCSDDGRQAILAVPPDGELTLIALAGEPAPDTPGGFVFDQLGLSWSALAQGGSITFAATLYSATELASAIYRWTPATGVEFVAWAAEPFPWQMMVLPTEVPVIAATDSIAWFEYAEAWGPDGAGGVRRIFASGDPVPGGPFDDAIFSTISLARPGPHPIWINARDQVAFATKLARRETFEPLGDAVFRADAGKPVEVIAKTGDLAPRTGGAIFATGLAVIAFGDAGEIAFRASIDPPGEGDLESIIYLVDSSRRLVPILSEADLAALGPFQTDPGLATFGFDALFTRASMSPSSYAVPDAVYVATIPEPTGFGGALAALLLLAALTSARRSPRA